MESVARNPFNPANPFASLSEMPAAVVRIAA
jgi:hypothetical protein